MWTGDWISFSSRTHQTTRAGDWTSVVCSSNLPAPAALIAAGAGCALAKHGNRSATGLSGSADVLEALGARIDLDPDAVARCIDRAGFGFMFAPAHHAATRYVVPVRKELAVRTIFNFLGP